MTMTAGKFKNRYMQTKLFHPYKKEPLQTFDDVVVEADDFLVEQDIKKKLSKYLLELTAREQTVIREMFFYEKTLEEVCKQFDVTRERVRQFKLSGLRKLSVLLKKDGDFLDLIA